MSEEVRLPEPWGYVGSNSVRFDAMPVGGMGIYTAGQMEVAILDERERIAAMFDRYAAEAWERGAAREANMHKDFAAAIRSGVKP